MRITKSSLFLFLLFAVGSIMMGCKSKFEKLRLSNDLEKKYEVAIEYYNEKKYEKAYTLLDDLVKRYRGRDNADELYYYYAYVHYRQKDYISARYHFKNLADTYTNSPYTEESRFMAAYTYYLTSPKVTLDQGDTEKAIENLNYFIYSYPDSELIPKCREYMEEMKDKLQKKALNKAQMYYNLGDHKASSVAYKSTLLRFPDSPYAEEIFFKAFVTQYLYAKGSYWELQFERYERSLEMYDDFIFRYPNSVNKEKADLYVDEIKTAMALWEKQNKEFNQTNNNN